jgi:hypothetical protein
MERNLGTKFCDQIGDYHIIDPDNGLYEVWYVNPWDNNDDILMSEHESFHSARWESECYAHADRIFNKGWVRGGVV